MSQNQSENRNNLFVVSFLKNRWIETCLESFLNPLDICVLRMCCKDFSKLPKKKTSQKKQFQIGSLAIKSGYFVLFSWIYENIFPHFHIDGNVATVAHSKSDEEEQIKIIEKFYEDYKIIVDFILQENGNLELLKWIAKKDTSFKERNYGICTLDYLPILKWFYQNGHNISDPQKLYINALKINDDEMLKWIKEIYPIGPSTNIVEIANIAETAALYGKIDFLNEIKDRLITKSWMNNLCIYYMKIGDLKSSKELINVLISPANVDEYDVNIRTILYMLAFYGHKDLFESIIAKNKLNLFFYVQAIEKSTQGGHLEFSKWLFTKCEIPKDNLGDCQRIAANNGHWEIVKWLQSIGVSIRYEEYLAKTGNLAIIKWLENNIIWHSWDWIYTFVRNGDLDVLKYIYECNYELPLDIILTAIESSQFEIVKWIKSNINNHTWNEKLFSVALENGDRRIISWLIKEKCPGFHKYKKLLKL